MLALSLLLLIQCNLSYNFLPLLPDSPLGQATWRCRYKSSSPYCMVTSHCAQTADPADWRPGRPLSVSLIIIDRWQLLCWFTTNREYRPHWSISLTYYGHFEFLIKILCSLSVNIKCALLWKVCFWFVYLDVVQIIFKMFEIAQNITKIRVVANSLVFTTNPRMDILNVKLCITKTTFFYWGLYMLLSLLIRITQQHTIITLKLISEFKIFIIIDKYRYFLQNLFDNRY